MWLATAARNEINPRTGGNWHHRAARRPHPAALDARFQRQLVDALASRTGLALSDAKEAT